MDIIVKKIYFKLLANIITFFIFEKFFLEKIKSNIKTDVIIFYSLIKEAFGIQKVNTTNDNKNISITTFLVTKSRKNCYFYYR